MGTGRRSPKRSAERPSSRAVALEAVLRVTDEGGYSNLVLPALLVRSELSARDRALASDLAYGTLRRKVILDHALSRLLKRPLAEAGPRARAALRVGAYQLMYTRVPDHAAVAETVSLVQKSQRGLVNAVLRRLAVEGPPRIAGRSDGAVAARVGVARWIVAELGALVGDQAEQAAAALAEPAGLTIRANPCRAPSELLGAALSEAGHHPEAGRLHPGSIRLPGARPTELPGYADGWFAVQDEASSWVVDVMEPRDGDLVLDACAAPGGKAADIACRVGGVVAADASESRLGLVREAAGRLGVSARLIVQDATRPALRAVFDRVLVDAPCSGVGSARRRPELLWRPRRRDIPGLSRLQVRIARAAASLLRPGGVLVYSVCTFPVPETDLVCRALEEGGLLPHPFAGPGRQEVARARLWPHLHGTDAMFVARFVRPVSGGRIAV